MGPSNKSSHILNTYGFLQDTSKPMSMRDKVQINEFACQNSYEDKNEYYLWIIIIKISVVLSTLVASKEKINMLYSV